MLCYKLLAHVQRDMIPLSRRAIIEKLLAFNHHPQFKTIEGAK